MRQILQSAMVAGLLLVAGLAITLSPSTSGQAQLIIQDHRKGAELEALQAADRQMQAEIEQLAAKLRDLEAVRRQHRDLAAKVKAASSESRTPEAKGGGPMGGVSPKDDARLRRATAGGGIAGPSQTDLSSRLESVEKKLDTVLWELTHLRQDLNKPRTAPGNRRDTTPGVPGGSRVPAPAGASADGPVLPQITTAPAAPPAPKAGPNR